VCPVSSDDQFLNYDNLAAISSRGDRWIERSCGLTEFSELQRPAGVMVVQVKTSKCDLQSQPKIDVFDWFTRNLQRLLGSFQQMTPAGDAPSSFTSPNAPSFTLLHAEMRALSETKGCQTPIAVESQTLDKQTAQKHNWE
jgi:hypothetical protein